MFIVCDVLDIPDLYKFRVWVVGPEGNSSYYNRPSMTNSLTAKGAMSYANGYIAGLMDAGIKSVNLPEIFKTAAFLAELKKEEEAVEISKTMYTVVDLGNDDVVETNMSKEAAEAFAKAYSKFTHNAAQVREAI